MTTMEAFNMTSCALGTGIILDGFCATEFPIDVGSPRSVRASGFVSNMLVLERDTESVVWLADSDNDGLPDVKQTVATAPGLNHGLAIHDGHLYASSDSTVYRWPIIVDLESAQGNVSYSEFVDINNMDIVVNNINRDGQGGAPMGHRTRTLEFDDSGNLYISVGSDGNVDPDSHRSRIRRVNMYQDNLTFPLDFQELEVFADGLRNTVGLGFDKHGVLWGVENGADNLQRDDLGGDITEDNPAEELNQFPEEDAGKHFGYPFCWTEYRLPDPYGNGTGSVWAWPDFLNNNVVSDEECRSEYVAPVVSMQAHSAPLGITFFDWKPELRMECGDVRQFPEWMDGYAFIAYHGSWNRDVPTGYKVVYVAMDENGNVVGAPVDLLAHQPPNANWDDGFRPVDVDFDECGRLIVTSDGTSGNGAKLVRIERIGSISEEPTGAPTAGVTGAPTGGVEVFPPVTTDAPTNTSLESSSPAPSNEAKVPSISPTLVSSCASLLNKNGKALLSIGMLLASI